jgi:hypothetical protein
MAPIAEQVFSTSDAGLWVLNHQICRRTPPTSPGSLHSHAGASCGPCLAPPVKTNPALGTTSTTGPSRVGRRAWPWMASPCTQPFASPRTCSAATGVGVLRYRHGVGDRPCCREPRLGVCREAASGSGSRAEGRSPGEKQTRGGHGDGIDKGPRGRRPRTSGEGGAGGFRGGRLDRLSVVGLWVFQDETGGRVERRGAR